MPLPPSSSPFLTAGRASPPLTAHQRRLWPAIAFFAAILGLSACRSAKLNEGFPCSNDGQCPTSFTCAADNKCYRAGAADASPSDASATVDAPIDTGTDGTVFILPGEGGRGGQAGMTGQGGQPGIIAQPNTIEAGLPCSSETDCKSGFCADGVCCNVKCDGACMACAEALTGAANGMCAPVNAGTDPHDSCTATAPEACGHDGQCDGAGACRNYGENQTCAPAVCMANQFSPARTCNGAGACGTAQPMDCGTSPCTATGCASPCTKDADCGANAYCSPSAKTCRVKKANGEGCELAAECGSAFCVDGVCCDTACTGACMACAETATGQKSGKCQPVQAGKDPGDDCPTDAPTTCGRDGACDGRGACRKYDSATTCAEASCSANQFTPARKCAAGACAPATAVSCGQAQCAVEGCRQGCTLDTDCAASAYCDNGTCVAKKGNGAACKAGNQCTSKACVDEKCCETACTGKCYACAMAKTGQADGKCAAVSAGADPDNECPNTEASTCGTDGQCDGAGACRMWAKGTQCAAGTCNTAGNYLSARTCDGVGACGAATTDTCAPNVCTSSGCSRTCRTDADCVGNTYCAPGMTCTAKKSMGAACGAGNECSSGFCVDEKCCDAKCDAKCVGCSKAKTGQNDGKCASIPNGQDPDNDCASDGKTCGLDGFCNGSGACRMTPSGTACGTAMCSNTSSFTPAGTCDGAGLCGGTTARPCSGGLICASASACKASCQTNSDCVAGNYCPTPGGTCAPKKNNGARCTPGSGAECSSGQCSPDGYCCNSACNASGVCQSCSTGTCQMTSSDTNTDPKNCGMCGKSCSAMATGGVAKCSGGACVPACAPNRRLCRNGTGYSCVGAVWDMETWEHKPWTCVGGGLLAPGRHGNDTSVELVSTGDRQSPECLTVSNEPSAGNAYCASTQDIDPFGGSRVGAWIMSPSVPATCWFQHDWGLTREVNVPQNVWTEISEIIPVRAATTSTVSIMCHLMPGASFFVDDFSVTQP